MAKDRKAPSEEKTSSSKKKEAGEKRETMSATGKITLAVLAFVGFIIVRGIFIGVQDSPEESLELPALSAETANIPEVFSDRKIPWEKIHDEMEGANLDKPRAYVGLYGQGLLHGSGWGEADGLKGAVADAYSKATEEADKRRTPSKADVAMLVIPTNRTGLRVDNYKGTFSNVHRGVRGAFVEPSDPKSATKAFRLSPTETVASNLAIVDALKQEATRRNVDLDEWLDQSSIYSFDAKQYFVALDTKDPAQEIMRGNRIIPVEEVTQKSVTEFTERLSRWMFSNLHPGGRMTYMYYPSTGRENSGNNMIRQWMGTVAMGRVANLHPELNLESRVRENIQYNLEHFYKTDGDLGYIIYQGNAKLGAAALAMISIIESPARESFAEYEKGLFNVTEFLWQDSGEFHCFYLPEERRKDNLHNFYPGETLLSWAFLYRENKSEELLDKSMKSYEYYKGWHLRNRNPAFIPWHTQAYYLLWKETKHEGLKDWIFEMNDWLVDTMQSESRVAYDDTLGRFYAPNRNFGVPHASSTGVYLEGLIDAFALAREIGDKKHEEKYRKAIVLGLRSSMQLQFADEIDLFFVRDKRRVLGGMRTTVYDNEIRVDNVQHVLMGVQKILQEFKPEDYQF